jgi:hypothetical protein
MLVLDGMWELTTQLLFCSNEKLHQEEGHDFDQTLSTRTAGNQAGTYFHYDLTLCSDGHFALPFFFFFILLTENYIGPTTFHQVLEDFVLILDIDVYFKSLCNKIYFI